MTPEIANVLVSAGVSAITAFAIVAFRMGRYSEKIDQIERCDLNTRLSKIEGRQLTRRNSPVDLTEFGNTVLNGSGGKTFVDAHYDELKRQVESRGTKTSFDIQESSRAAVGALHDDARMNGVKEYLFKEGMQWEDMVEVLGIYLRNRILDERHIDRKDIDRHTAPKAA